MALCAIIIVAILRDKIVNNQFRSITVMGQGRVSYTPDTATINLGVQVNKTAKAEDVLNQLNSKMTKVIDAIKTLGITEENISTQNYNLVPQYDYSNVRPMSYSASVGSAPMMKGGIAVPEVAPSQDIAVSAPSTERVYGIVGYSANQQLTVKIKDLKNNQALLSKVIGKATEAGVNQILGITFEASNLNDLKQEARVKAITDAKSKASALASAAGVKLKDITGWYENFLKGGYYGDAAMGMGGAGGGVSAPMAQITVGDNEVFVEIGVTYNIKD